MLKGQDLFETDVLPAQAGLIQNGNVFVDDCCTKRDCIPQNVDSLDRLFLERIAAAVFQVSEQRNSHQKHEQLRCEEHYKFVCGSETVDGQNSQERIGERL